MITGKRSMGMHKHGISGRSGKSPKARLAEKMDAEKADRKPRKCKMSPSINELFKREGK